MIKKESYRCAIDERKIVRKYNREFRHDTIGSSATLHDATQTAQRLGRD